MHQVQILLSGSAKVPGELTSLCEQKLYNVCIKINKYKIKRRKNDRKKSWRRYKEIHNVNPYPLLDIKVFITDT